MEVESTNAQVYTAPLKVDREEALEAVRTILSYLGEDVHREGIRETPRRVLDSLREMTRSPEFTATTFEEASDSLVLVRGIRFSSLCEHHLLPFMGEACVGYIPRGRVIGLSKIPRLVEKFSRRLQLQERLGNQIADTLAELVGSPDVYVQLRAQHLCMACRGVEQLDSDTITSVVKGVFRNNSEARQEVITLCRP